MIITLSFFGGLRKAKIMDLKVEKISLKSKGVYVSHNRVKQRSDKKESKFLIPRSSGSANFAQIVEDYINLVKDDLGKSVGRILWTGTHDSFVNRSQHCWKGKLACNVI